MRGRRRVGKSYLMSVAFAGERVLGLQADEQDERGHLDLFALEVRVGYAPAVMLSALAEPSGPLIREPIFYQLNLDRSYGFC